MAYDIDFNQKAMISFHIRKFLLYPDAWKNAENQLQINLTWNFCKFEELNHNLIPKKSGIYCFVVKPDYPHFFEISYLFYIGKTNRTLQQRFKEYLRNQAKKDKPRPKIFEMLTLYKENLYFYYAEVDTVTNVDICEEKLLNTFVPHINTSIPKATINLEFQNIYES